MTLTFTVLAPVFIAAGNYLLISRLIRAVLPPSSHRILGIPGRRLTPIFVACDIIAFLVQGSGSGIASSDNWTGPNEKLGRYVLIGGLVFQLIAFSLFLAVFGRFHFLANRYEVADAPKGWRRLLIAVYCSSILIMVSKNTPSIEFIWPFCSLPITSNLYDMTNHLHITNMSNTRSAASTAYASSPRDWMDTHSAPNGCSGCSRVCQWRVPSASFASFTQANTSRAATLLVLRPRGTTLWSSLMGNERTTSMCER